VIGVYRDRIDLTKDRTRETLVKPIAVVRQTLRSGPP
jgi:hypothetical protein